MLNMKYLGCSVLFVLILITCVSCVDDFTRRTRSLTNIFENEQVQSAYDYAEYLGDGRGVTFGMIGFVTEGGDGLRVIERYKAKKPSGNPFDPFMKVLKNGGKGLNKQAFIAAVKTAGKDQAFIDAQEEIWRQEYWTPSQNKAAELGLKLPLSKAQLYDTWVQHGEEDEPGCCLGALGIIRRTKKKVADGEKAWLSDFLKQRRVALTTARGDTAEEWRQSTGRVDVYESLVTAGAWQMDKPISLGSRRNGAYNVTNADYKSLYVS